MFFQTRCHGVLRYRHLKCGGQDRKEGRKGKKEVKEV
jgi:hypothetical protein